MARRRKRKPRRRPAPTAEAGSDATADSGATDLNGGGNRNRTGPSTPGIRPGTDEPPPAPWGKFPLMQLAVLSGLIMIAIGVATTNLNLLMIGLALGSLGGLELSVREHLAGYRSHTALLAGVGFVLVTGVAFFGLQLVLWLCLLVGAIVFGLGLWLWRRSFMHASGGLSYRLR